MPPRQRCRRSTRTSPNGPRRPASQHAGGHLQSTRRPREATMIIDCHGHYTTSPRQHEAWRTEQIAAHGEGRLAPPRPRSATTRSAPASWTASSSCSRSAAPTSRSSRRARAGMGHHLGDAATSAALDRAHCNELIHRVCTLFPRQLRRRVHAAADRRRVAAQLHRRAGALRASIRLRRLQPEPRSLRRLLEGSAAHRPLLVSAVREDGRARRAGDDPRQRVLQSGVPHHRRRTT